MLNRTNDTLSALSKYIYTAEDIRANETIPAALFILKNRPLTSPPDPKAGIAETETEKALINPDSPPKTNPEFSHIASVAIDETINGKEKIPYFIFAARKTTHTVTQTIPAFLCAVPNTDLL